MSQLTYLMDEICAGVEIYYTGRTGQQYLKTAFILCDDYTELVSKLFLLDDKPTWSDQKDGKFKNYHDVMLDVETVFSIKRPKYLLAIQTIQAGMKTRRDRRNDFFHSTHLLDLSVNQRMCVEAFCGLLDYGELLFPAEWRPALANARNLETLEVLLRLEMLSFSDPSIQPKVNKILADWPRNTNNPCRKGVHLAIYPEDLHLRLCVTCGGKALRDKLVSLFSTEI